MTTTAIYDTILQKQASYVQRTFKLNKVFLLKKFEEGSITQKEFQDLVAFNEELTEAVKEIFEEFQ